MNSLPSDEYLAKKYPNRGSFVVQGKTVNIPAVYKGKGLTAVFPISYKKASELVHSKDIKPARLSLTKALLSITVFDFSESPIGPYTELAYAIPVLYKPRFDIPFLPLLLNNSWKNLGYYVLDLLQSTDIAIAHGKILSEYPHNNNLITLGFTNTDKEGSVSSVTNGGKKILSLSASHPRSEKNVFRPYMTYFEKDGRLLRIKMDIYGTESKVKNCTLNLGDNELSGFLQTLGVSSKSLQTFYYSDFVEVLPVTKEKL